VIVGDVQIIASGWACWPAAWSGPPRGVRHAPGTGMAMDEARTPC